MAGRADIMAGKAFVLLSVKDQLAGGLKTAMQVLRTFGNAAKISAVALGGIGAVAIGGIAAAVKHFSDAGSALNDMSERTGVSANMLAKLGYAADQAGASMEDVEMAIKKSQKEGKDFFKVAEAIQAVEDPAKRTQMALENWGKSGTKLLPMINNLKGAMGEAMAPTDSQVRMADAFGDAWGKMMHTVKAGVFEIGAAFAPMILPAVEALTTKVREGVVWLRDNLKTMFGGIGDALVAGDFTLAWNVALKEIELATSETMAGIATMIGGQLGDTFATIGTKVIKGDFAGAYQTALKQMQVWTQEFAEGMITMFAAAAKSVINAWKGIEDHITDWLLQASADGMPFANNVLGIDMSKVKDRADKLEAERQAMMASKGIATTPQGDVIEESKAFAKQITQGIADGIKDNLSDLEAASQAMTDELSKSLADDVKDGTKEAIDGLGKLREELVELKRRAAEGKAAAMAKWDAASPSGAKMLDSAGTTLATFSASALRAGMGTQQAQPIKADPDELRKLDQMILKLGKLELARFAV